MNNNFQEAILNEIPIFLEPLLRASESEIVCKQLFAELGWDLSMITDFPIAELLESLTALAVAFNQVETWLETPPTTLEDFRKSQKAVKQTLTIIQDFHRVLEKPGLVKPLGFDRLASELIEFLLINYLVERFPAGYVLGLLTTLISTTDAGVPSELVVDQVTANLVRHPSLRPRLHLERIPKLLQPPFNLLRAEYLPNNLATYDDAQVAASRLFPRLAALLGLMGIHTISGLNSTIGVSLGPGGDAVAKLSMGVFFPLHSGPTPEGDGFGATFSLSPYNHGDLGLVFLPFGRLAFSEIVDGWEVDFQLEGGIDGFAFHPLNGIKVPDQVQSVQITLRAILKKLSDNPDTAFLIGSTVGTRLEIGNFSVKGEVKLTNTQQDYSILLVVGKAAIVMISHDGDGFLQEILPRDGCKINFDLAIGWSNINGFYFRGSSGLEATLPVQLDIMGILKIPSVYLSLKAKSINNESLIEAITAVTVSLKLGPLAAQIEQMGLQAKLSFPPSGGNLGVAGFDLAFKPPTGLSLTLNAQGITGGGFLSFRPDLAEYKGGLVFEFQKLFTFRAIGIINTKLPGGEPGFSLFIMITGQFPPVQLSFGFTLSGLGGLFGYNRTIDTDVLNQMVLSGRAANLLFPPADTDLNQIVNDAGQAFPVKAGNFVFGPMARIGWGTPTIITAEIGLAIEVPDPVRVAMLGVIRVTLPEPDAPVARLNMVFLGVLDFSRKLFTLQATLFDSQLLSFALTGDFAMYISWGQQPLFIFSAGGFHPAYKEAPPQLNALRRLSLTLIDTQELKIGVQTYLALTSNTVQIGARAQVWGKTAIAEFNGLLWFDVLFQLDPFQFQAEAQLIAGVKIFGQDIAAVHLTAVLAGPGPWHFRGHGYVEIARLKKEVRCELAWGIQAPNLAPPSVDVWEMLKQEVAKKENWQSTPLPDSSLSGVSVKDLSQEEGIVLLPNVQLTFKQKLVPFGVELQKFGNAIPQQRYFEIQSVRLGKVSLATQEMIRVDELFAPASFLQLSDAEKLSRPSFENMQGGVAIRAASASGEVRGTPTECPVEYELKYIRAKEIIPQKAAVPLSPTEMLQEARAGSSFRSPLSREQTRPSYAAVASVMPRQEGFVLVQGRELSPFSENGQPLLFTSQTEAYQKRQKLGREDLLVMSTLEMEN